MVRLTLVVTLLAAYLVATDAATALPEGAPPPQSWLPIQGGAIHVLVNDINSDGRLDLVFTSHSNNDLQVYRQVAPRRFEAGDPQELVGFHPNDLIVLPGHNRYLSNAEGESKLKILKIQPESRFELVAERPQSAPRASTSFSWPGWGLSLAVAPYSGKILTLLRDFNPETAEVRQVYSFKLGDEPKHVRLADLNGDGIDALVLASRLSNELWVIDYPGPDKEPDPRRLWSFERGWPRHVLPFDVNRDGAMDLLVPMAVRQEIVVLLNDGKGHFTESPPIAYPGQSGIHVMATGQEKDGMRYLLAGGIHALVLYRELKDTPGVFENINLPLVTLPNWLELKDIDGDGWLDAIVASQGTQVSMVIYGPLWERFTTIVAGKKPD